MPPGLCPIFGTQLHAADHPKSRLRTHLRSARCGLDRALRAVPRQKAVIDVDFVLAFGLLVLSFVDFGTTDCISMTRYIYAAYENALQLFS